MPKRSRSIGSNNLIRDRELNQHFTNPRLAQWLVDAAAAHVPKRALFVEPSAGDGSIFSRLPNPKIGIELDKTLAVAHGFVVSDFLKWQPPATTRPIVTIGNPPFNEARVVGNYRPKPLALQFINHAAEFSEVVAFILGRNFLKPGIQNKVDRRLHLRYQKILPKKEFGTVGTVFQVWVKSTKLRKLYKFKRTNDFEIVPYSDRRANLAVTYWGDVGRVTTNPKNIDVIRDGAMRRGVGHLKGNFASSMLLYAKNLRKVERILRSAKAQALFATKKLTSSGNNPTINMTELHDIYVKSL